jgi:hypothetical protein
VDCDVYVTRRKLVAELDAIACRSYRLKVLLRLAMQA